jgi:hypothetical protein
VGKLLQVQGPETIIRRTFLAEEVAETLDSTGYRMIPRLKAVLGFPDVRDGLARSGRKVAA